MRGERLFLIDGPALAYRSYFALINNPLTTSAGELTSVPFGFARALGKIAADDKPEYWAVVFDSPAPTFRHKEFEDYKANRPPMPEEMRPQLERVNELLEALRVPQLMVEGYEADDLMGTVAVRAAAEGLSVALVSGDKDLCQIVDDRIQVHVLAKGDQPAKVMDRAAVEEKFGVPPEKMVDMLALMGDASDNVPGVRGVGAKTAAKLIKAYGSLEEIYRRIDEVKPPGLGEKLRAGEGQAYLSRRLVTLTLDAPCDPKLKDLRRVPPDRDEVVRLLTELEFSRVAEVFVSPKGGAGLTREGSTAGSVDVESMAIDAERDRPAGDEPGVRQRQGPAGRLERAGAGAPEGSLRAYVGERRKQKAGGEGALVGEPGGREGAAGPWAFSLHVDPDLRTGLAVCAHSRAPVYEEASSDEDRAVLEDFLADAAYHKAVYDLKTEAHAASVAGWKIRGVINDVMLASYLLNPEEKHDLESLAGRWVGGSLPLEIEITSDAALRRRAQVVSELDRLLSPKIRQAGMEELLREIEIPLALVLQEMEQAGVAINLEGLADLGGRLEGMIRSSEEEIYCMAGTTFNINSPQQLSDVLFAHLGLRPKRKTKRGYSTDSVVLEELAAEHEIAREILNYRQLVKLKSTYVDALPKLVCQKTKRVHATFHQAVTATGRLSSSNPNLQNIPVRTELGREIRKAFVPGKADWVLVAADYSQIELRIMAHLSGDKALTESFLRDEDVHAATASAVFGVPLERVDEDLRSRAKMVNYGVMYGMGSTGLARRLGIKRDEAAQFIEEYFAKMPGVKAFLESLVEQARVTGFATTIMNRRRPLPAILSSDRRARAYSERMAVNTPIQGSAADIIKKAMVEISRRCAELSMAAKLILQVHDELVFECPRDESEPLCKLVSEIMESAVAIRVPLSVNMGVGDNWWETHR